VDRQTRNGGSNGAHLVIHPKARRHAPGSSSSTIASVRPLERRTRVSGIHSLRSSQARQGGRALQVEVIRDDDVVGVGNVGSQETAIFGPQCDLDGHRGVKDEDRQLRPRQALAIP
jgi:hypothetical protein